LESLFGAAVGVDRAAGSRPQHSEKNSFQVWNEGRC